MNMCMRNWFCIFLVSLVVSRRTHSIWKHQYIGLFRLLLVRWQSKSYINIFFLSLLLLVELSVRMNMCLCVCARFYSDTIFFSFGFFLSLSLSYILTMVSMCQISLNSVSSHRSSEIQTREK